MIAFDSRVLRMKSVSPVLSFAIAVLALLTGCIPIPLPTHATEPRYSETQLVAVGSELNTRDDIRAKLGTPDLEVADERAWIYEWKIEHGKFFAIPLLPLAAGNIGPITTDEMLFVLEFDRSGNFHSKGFAAEDKGAGVERYCTSGGVCIEHRVDAGIDEDRNGLVITRFEKYFSAVTLRDSAKERFPGPTLQDGGCLLTIWLDAEWSRRRGGFWRAQAPHGLTISVVPSRSDHGIPFGQDFQGTHWWLPSGSYAQFALSGGDYSVIGQGVPQISSADFSCPVGSEIHLSIVRGTKDSQDRSIVLRPVDKDKAKTIIAGMSRLILD